MDYHQYFVTVSAIWTQYFNGEISAKKRDEALAYWRQKLNQSRKS